MSEKNNNPEGCNPCPEHVENAISEKADSIEALAADKLPLLTARQECYKRIIGSAKEHMEAYYRRFPERAVDERSKDAEAWSLATLREAFNILDEYEITRRSH
jgi:hypothetical protein